MGHLFTSDSLKLDLDKAQAMQEIKPPTDVEAIQKLNGFVNYLVKFLPQLADIILERTCNGNGTKSRIQHLKKSRV